MPLRSIIQKNLKPEVGGVPIDPDLVWLVTKQNTSKQENNTCNTTESNSDVSQLTERQQKLAKFLSIGPEVISLEDLQDRFFYRVKDELYELDLSAGMSAVEGLMIQFFIPMSEALGYLQENAISGNHLTVDSMKNCHRFMQIDLPQILGFHCNNEFNIAMLAIIDSLD